MTTKQKERMLSTFSEFKEIMGHYYPELSVKVKKGRNGEYHSLSPSEDDRECINVFPSPRLVKFAGKEESFCSDCYPSLLFRVNSQEENTYFGIPETFDTSKYLQSVQLMPRVQPKFLDEKSLMTQINAWLNFGDMAKSIPPLRDFWLEETRKGSNKFLSKQPERLIDFFKGDKFVPSSLLSLKGEALVYFKSPYHELFAQPLTFMIHHSTHKRVVHFNSAAVFRTTEAAALMLPEAQGFYSVTDHAPLSDEQVLTAMMLMEKTSLSFEQAAISASNL